jgi:leader peptidase (prepilin peptidase)/N-methyltransferase
LFEISYFSTLLNNIQLLCQEQPSFFYLSIALLSLSVGSFLNVVIYRLPKMMEQAWYSECREFLADEIVITNDTQTEEPTELTLSKPVSTCPHCQHKIRFYENIPLVSWLFLRGKCSQCKEKISIRYPSIELATALLSLVVAHHFGPTYQMLLMLVLTWGLVALTMIDFDHMLLPDQITLPLLWLGLLININGTFVPLSDAVIGATAGYLSLFSVYWLFKLLTGKEGMGFGDFKLLAVFGAWAGWQLLPLLILMASIVGAVIGIALIVFKSHQKDQGIPFGPYLAIAGWITILWGNELWSWYLATLL